LKTLHEIRGIDRAGEDGDAKDCDSSNPGKTKKMAMLDKEMYKMTNRISGQDRDDESQKLSTESVEQVLNRRALDFDEANRGSSSKHPPVKVGDKFTHANVTRVVTKVTPNGIQATHTNGTSRSVHDHGYVQKQMVEQVEHEAFNELMEANLPINMLVGPNGVGGGQSLKSAAKSLMKDAWRSLTGKQKKVIAKVHKLTQTDDELGKLYRDGWKGGGNSMKPGARKAFDARVKELVPNEEVRDYDAAWKSVRDKVKSAMKDQNESVEQVDELSGDKLHDYLSKSMRASDNHNNRMKDALKVTGTAKTASTVRRAQRVANNQANKRTKRELGIQQALWKQTGKAKVNATEEVEVMKEAAGQPTGVHIHMKAPNGKITKTTFLGTHSAVGGAKKHIAGLEKKGHTVHKKELAFAEGMDMEYPNAASQKTRAAKNAKLIARNKRNMATAKRKGVKYDDKEYRPRFNEDAEQVDESVLNDIRDFIVAVGAAIPTKKNKRNAENQKLENEIRMAMQADPEFDEIVRTVVMVRKDGVPAFKANGQTKLSAYVRKTVDAKVAAKLGTLQKGHIRTMASGEKRAVSTPFNKKEREARDAGKIKYGDDMEQTHRVTAHKIGKIIKQVAQRAHAAQKNESVERVDESSKMYWPKRDTILRINKQNKDRKAQAFAEKDPEILDDAVRDINRYLKKSKGNPKTLSAYDTKFYQSSIGKIERISGKTAAKKQVAQIKKKYKGVKESVEQVDEAVDVAKEIETYARRAGGIDKKDMLKVASLLKRGDKKAAIKFAKRLDSDPRDFLLSKMNEDAEQVDELSVDTLSRYNSKASKDPKRAKMNNKAVGKIVKKTMQGAAQGKPAFFSQRLQGESVEQVDELSNKLLKRYDRKAATSAANLRRKMDKTVATVRKSASGYATQKQASRFTKAMDKHSNRMDGQDRSQQIKLKRAQKESVEQVDEGSTKKIGKEIEDYANKQKRIDPEEKRDILKVAAMMKKGDSKGAIKFAKSYASILPDFVVAKVNPTQLEQVDAVREARMRLKQFINNNNK